MTMWLAIVRACARSRCHYLLKKHKDGASSSSASQWRHNATNILKIIDDLTINEDIALELGFSEGAKWKEPLPTGMKGVQQKKDKLKQMENVVLALECIADISNGGQRDKSKDVENDEDNSEGPDGVDDGDEDDDDDEPSAPPFGIQTKCPLAFTQFDVEDASLWKVLLRKLTETRAMLQVPDARVVVVTSPPWGTLEKKPSEGSQDCDAKLNETQISRLAENLGKTTGTPQTPRTGMYTTAHHRRGCNSVLTPPGVGHVPVEENLRKEWMASVQDAPRCGATAKQNPELLHQVPTGQQRVILLGYAPRHQPPTSIS